MGKLSLRAAAIAVLLCALPNAAFGDTVLQNGTTLTVYGGLGTNPPTPPTSSTRNPTAIVYADTQTTSGADYHSTDTYLFNNSQITTYVDEKRGGPGFSFSESIGQVFFKVTIDTAYAASGMYSVQDNDTTLPGHVFYNTYLVDLTSNSLFFFQSYDESLHTPNAVFHLGDNQGDATNIVYGSLTGTLLANHSYELYHQYFIQGSTSPTDGGASATGFLTLGTGDPVTNSIPAPIPAPFLGVTALMGGLGLLQFIKRRNLAQSL